MDVSQVDIGVILLVDDTEDCIDSHGGQEVRVLRHDLGGEGGDGILDELLAVI